MKTINVRELRSTMPQLPQLLAQEHELVLVSNGQPIARILPPEPAPRLRSLAKLRARIGRQLPDSTSDIRAERDERGS